MLVLQCLSDAFNEQIKAKEPTKKAFYEPKDHSFSKAGGDGYGTFHAWLNFQKEILKFSETRPYLVVTDVANYYDSISYVHLRNVIAGTVGGEECILDMLIFVLSGLLWQPDYMPRMEIGLPQINIDAPRALAHCFLYELDAYLEKENPDFARFMDDIDIGVESIADAKAILRNVDLLLQTRQVRLNSGKTKILSQSEAHRHFRVDENIQLDILKSKIERELANGNDAAGEKKELRRLFSNGLKKASFDDGNGEKILKRIVNLAALANVALPVDELYFILRRWPGSQSAVLSYISRTKCNAKHIQMLTAFLKSGIVVDDVTQINIANHALEIRIHSLAIAPEFENLWTSISDRTYFGLYARIWLASKYISTAELWDFLRHHRSRWEADLALGRLVGGTASRFWKSTEQDKFQALISTSKNEGALQTSEFHASLRSDVNAVYDTSKFFKSPNTSKPNHITHSKFLCLLSVLSNSKLSAQMLQKVVNQNATAWGDKYYLNYGKRASAMKGIL